VLQELWDQIHNKIDQHGLKLDIIFEDPKYAPENYKHISMGAKNKNKNRHIKKKFGCKESLKNFIF